MDLGGAPIVLLGTAASVLILSGWVHQAVKGYRTKSMGDISSYLTILIGVGAALWLIYGVFLSDPYIVGTNVAALALMSLISLMKRRYDLQKRRLGA